MTQRRRVRDDEEDLATKEAQIDLENRDKREDQQRRMAWIAMISMIVLTAFLFLLS